MKWFAISLCVAGTIMPAASMSQDPDFPLEYPITNDSAMEVLPIWSPADSFIAYTTGDIPEVDLHFIRPNGTDHIVYAGKGIAWAWFSDGERVLVTQSVDGRWRLKTVALDGTETDLGKDLAQQFTDFIVTPDDRAVIWGERSGNACDLVRMAIGDTATVRLAQAEGPIAPCAWSADGDRLVVWTQAGRDSVVLGYLAHAADDSVAEMDSVRYRTIDWPGEPPAERPTFAADGVRAAYNTTRSELYYVDTSGGTPIKLPVEQHVRRRPSLSPDGTRLVVPTRRPAGAESPTMWDLWIVDVDRARRP